jgi:hypothetical protein
MCWAQIGHLSFKRLPSGMTRLGPKDPHRCGMVRVVVLYPHPSPAPQPRDKPLFSTRREALPSYVRVNFFRYETGRVAHKAHASPSRSAIAAASARSFAPSLCIAL